MSLGNKDLLFEGRGIRKKYVREGFLGSRQSTTDALRGIDIKMRRGDLLGVVGESGSGKSTLAKIICGLEDLSSGELTWNVKPSGKSHPAQMVFQNPFNSLNPKLKVGYTLREALAYGGFKRMASVRKEEVVALLDKVGMNKVNPDAYPHQFSGGQRQRIAIARALALNPAVLVCDEPVSALDISIQAQILNLLKEINKKNRLAIMFIAHDIEAVGMISKDVIVMKEGSIVERGDVVKIIKSPEEEYTKKLIEAVPVNPYL